MKRMPVGWMLVLLVACGPMAEPELDIEPETAPAQEESEPVEREDVGKAAQTICGTSCPSGYHPTSYSCDSIRCGGRCGFDTKNQVTCAPDSGVFTQCGTSCPAGYHPTSYSCNSISCGGSCGSYIKNQATCAPDSGVFTQCGTSCPSGWSATSYSCNAISCGGSCGFGNQNQASCTPL